MGFNGHFEFKKKEGYLKSNTHKDHHTPERLNHPRIKNKGCDPVFGLTLGMYDIFQSKKVLLLANGKHKKEVTKQFMEKQVATQLPASFLWLHQYVTCFWSRDAWNS